MNTFTELDELEYKKVQIEYWLCFFLGWAGAHRFYKKKYLTAFAYLFTFGGFFIGWLIDFLVLVFRFNKLMTKKKKATRQKDINEILTVAFISAFFVGTIILCLCLGISEGEIALPTINESTTSSQISNTDSIAEETETETATVETTIPEETVNNRYETEISWALEEHLAIAVAIDDYNGDIVEAGTYRFYPDSVVLGTGKIPTVWDIYVSNKIYNDISQLHDDNPDFVGCVGGLNKDEITVTLEEGQYIYVKHYKVANNNPTGILMIQKIED